MSDDDSRDSKAPDRQDEPATTTPSIRARLEHVDALTRTLLADVHEPDGTVLEDVPTTHEPISDGTSSRSEQACQIAIAAVGPEAAIPYRPDADGPGTGLRPEIKYQPPADAPSEDGETRDAEPDGEPQVETPDGEVRDENPGGEVHAENPDGEPRDETLTDDPRAQTPETERPDTPETTRESDIAEETREPATPDETQESDTDSTDPNNPTDAVADVTPTIALECECTVRIDFDAELNLEVEIDCDEDCPYEHALEGTEPTAQRDESETPERTHETSDTDADDGGVEDA